ncbi:MAG: DUF6318 family protein [Actinomyces sp.]|nr:DUF6318 family protein [Actinomyces sp.]
MTPDAAVRTPTRATCVLLLFLALIAGGCTHSVRTASGREVSEPHPQSRIESTATSMPGPDDHTGGGQVSGGSPDSAGDSAQAGPPQSGIFRIDAHGRVLRPAGTPAPMPPLPGTHTHRSLEAARDHAQYFVGVLEYSWNSGDTALLRSVGAPECEYCTRVATHIDDLYSQGGWEHGYTFDVTGVEAPLIHDDRQGIYRVVVHVLQGGGIGFDGTTLRTFGTSEHSMAVHTCRLSETWQVCGVESVGQAGSP